MTVVAHNRIFIYLPGSTSLSQARRPPIARAPPPAWAEAWGDEMPARASRARAAPHSLAQARAGRPAGLANTKPGLSMEEPDLE